MRIFQRLLVKISNFEAKRGASTGICRTGGRFKLDELYALNGSASLYYTLNGERDEMEPLSEAALEALIREREAQPNVM